MARWGPGPNKRRDRRRRRRVGRIKGGGGDDGEPVRSPPGRSTSDRLRAAQGRRDDGVPGCGFWRHSARRIAASEHEPSHCSNPVAFPRSKFVHGNGPTSAAASTGITTQRSSPTWPSGCRRAIAPVWPACTTLGRDRAIATFWDREGVRGGNPFKWASPGRAWFQPSRQRGQAWRWGQI